MTPELTALTLAALLQVVQFVIYSITAQKQVGSKSAASPRDTPRQLTGAAGRAQRTMTHHLAGPTLVSIAVMVLTWSDGANETTSLLAMTYLVARILYLPAYLFGWAPWRSLIWAVGFFATVSMLIMALI